ncbi:glycoside hydrolase family 16 protein [Podospora didyma]|uniref:Glycoside hydrolase family 16 protein n=1 Tax=Podospora didyma TaxID=330526 RepID=A0AAE0P563_9PEZI|nr:glycoside hydrolase family 16 protein [Podospora didyma]
MVRGFHLASIICMLLETARAAIPQLTNYHVVWADDFNGPQGSATDRSYWNQITPTKNSNGELQRYTDSPANAHLSGDGQLYIIPKRSPNDNTWTSARLESTGSWVCPPGKAMVYQAEIRVPDFSTGSAQFKGLWPAFWALGNSVRWQNVRWPQCGEWDILEAASPLRGQNQGTLHFLDAGGHLNSSLQNRVAYQGGAYHTWALKVDRRSGDWRQQKLTWYLDGNPFHSVTGAQIGHLQQWTELAYMKFFVILNVAVGGGFPGNPTAATVGGYEASMRVRYVGVYESN